MNTQITLPPVIEYGETPTVPLAERLREFPVGESHGGTAVIIRQVAYAEDEALLNMQAALLDVGYNDPWRTFRVRVNGDTHWVHNVTVAAATDSTDSTREQYEAFRQQVRDVAIRVAEEQGWCDDGLNDVLDELGLDRKEFPRQRIEVKVTRTFTIEATPNRLDPDEEWTRASMSLDGDGEPSLDGDWSEEYVLCSDEDFEVIDVTEA